MKVCRNIMWTTLLVALTAAPALAQPPGEQMPPMPKPGPEHEVLKADVGTWDAVIEFIPAPGAAPVTSKGVEVNTLGCGGRCLITDFKGEAMGMPFHGHGVTVWDAAKKKYVGSWVDSMATGMATGEHTYDAAAKKLEGWVEAPDPSGKTMKSRMVMVYANGTRTMTAYTTGPDGKDVQTMKMTYTRRK